ncbi:MAG: hypothetical protein ACJ79Q_06265 [Gemmatimonadaceae bacterium]|jgi:hypothetical protein
MKRFQIDTVVINANGISLKNPTGIAFDATLWDLAFWPKPSGLPLN